MTTKLPNNLKYLRIKNNYSQDDIAQKLFVSHQTISNHETGKSQPTLEIIQKYADFYQVDFHDLINIDLSKENKNTKVIFDSVIFDKRDKTMIILDGTKGTYFYDDIVECKILNERSSRKGKETPFTHTVVNGKFQACALTEPTFYVGLKLTMKDHSTLAIYTSKVKTFRGTDLHKHDRKEAEKIKHIIDRSIEKRKEAI